MPTTLLNHFKEIESNLKGQKYIYLDEMFP